jgi:large-conductance mechanosensitive channel
MDADTPKGLVAELRTTILRKRVGQIALAVVLAEAIWRLVNALTWYLIIPLIGKFLHGQTESVLLDAASRSPIRWDTLFGSVLEFVLVVIVVVFLNRWIHRKPLPPKDEEPTEDDAIGGSIT